MNIAYHTINWAGVEKTEHKGTTGTAFWQTLQYEELRVRLVEYSAGYLADHWCRKGHIVHCLSGSFITEMENGESHALSAGMSYIVTDELSSHRSVSAYGAQLLIIDGDFLRSSA